MLKRFKDLSEKEIVAVAIANEEEDGRIYGEFADALRDSYPATAEMFEEMRVEEAGHRDRLLALFRQRFGDLLPFAPVTLDNLDAGGFRIGFIAFIFALEDVNARHKPFDACNVAVIVNKMAQGFAGPRRLIS